MKTLDIEEFTIEKPCENGEIIQYIAEPSIIEGNKIHLDYFYRYFHWKMDGTLGWGLYHPAEYHNCPQPIDELILEARKYCEANNLVLWTY